MKRYNEKAILLKPNQSLYFKIKSYKKLDGTDDELNCTVSASSSCLEFLDDNGTFYTIKVKANEIIDEEIVPSDASINLTSHSNITTDGTIIIPENMSTKYTVSKYHYITQAGTIIANDETGEGEEFDSSTNTKTKTLVIEKAKKFKIESNVPYATITLLCGNYVQENNEIWVPSGSTINWSVTADHYQPQSGQEPNLTEDDTKTINLVLDNHTFTVYPDPLDAKVRLFSDDGRLYGWTYDHDSSITIYTKDAIPKDGDMTYNIDGTPTDGHIPGIGEGTLEDTHVSDYNKQTNSFKVKYNSHIDCLFVRDEEKDYSSYHQVDNSITVPYGTNITYEVSKDKFETISGKYKVLSDYTMPIRLNYAEGAVIFESNKPITENIILERPGIFEIIVIGGAGGSSASGGGGKGYHAGNDAYPKEGN